MRRAAPFDLTKFEPDLKVIAKLKREPLEKVRAEFDTVRASDPVRKKAREERKDNVRAMPGLEVPTADEFAARLAVDALKAPLKAALKTAPERLEFERSFEKLRQEQVPTESRLPPGPFEFEIAPGRFVIVTDDAVSLVFVRYVVKHGEKSEERGDPIPVVSGRVRPIRKLTVESEVYYEVEFSPGVRRTGTFDQILTQLDRREGRVLSRQFGHDVLASLLHHTCRTAEPSWPTYGMYADAEGKLVEVSSPTPIRDEHQAVSERVNQAVAYEPTKEDLEVWAGFIRFYDAYEVCPILGLGAISPFALELRRKAVLVPHSLLFSKGHNLGKTKLAFAVSGAFGREPGSAGALNSEFRFPANVDASCTAYAVDEAESFRWDKFGADLKVAAETPNIAKRGQRDLSQERYLSRSVLLFTGNSGGLVSETLLSRFLLIHFDEAKRVERGTKRAEFDRVYSRLAPVGPAVARTILREHPTVRALMERVDAIAAEIEQAVETEGFALRDPRRARSWAVAYLGLAAWGKLASELGAVLPVPTVEEFIRRVVRRVESETFEGVLTPLDAFRAWWEGQKARDTTSKLEVRVGESRYGEPHASYDRVDAIRTEGRTWEAGALEVPARGETRRVLGDYVTLTVLGDYLRQARPDLKFESLKDLAVTALRESGFDERSILDKDGGVARYLFSSGRRTRAAFVPYEGDGGLGAVPLSGAPEERQSTLEESSGQTSVPSCPNLSQGGTAGQVPDRPLSRSSADGEQTPPDSGTENSGTLARTPARVQPVEGKPGGGAT